MNRKKFNLGEMINRRQEADRAASKAAEEAEAAETAETKQALPKHSTTDDLKLAEACKASAEKVAASVTPYDQYKLLKRIDPKQAGDFWRANKDRILGCYKH